MMVIFNNVTRRCLVETFGRWADYAPRAAASRAASRRASRFCLTRRVTCAFTTWHEHAVRSHRALRFWLNAAMGSAFRRWIDAAVEIAETRELIQLADARLAARVTSTTWVLWAMAARDARKGRMAAAYFMNIALLRALQTWQETVVAVLEERAALARAVKHLSLAVLSAGFFGWAERVQEAREMKARVAQAVGFMLNRTVHGALATWREATLEAREMRARLARAVRFMLNRTACGALATWKGAAVEARVNRAKVAVAAGKMKKRAVAGSWAKWLELMEDKAVLEAKMKVAMNTWLLKELHVGFQAFMRNRDSAKIMRRGLVFFINATLYRCVHHWADFAMEQQTYRAAITKVDLKQNLLNPLPLTRICTQNLELGTLDLESEPQPGTMHSAPCILYLTP
jgi:hypothetical protein